MIKTSVSDRISDGKKVVGVAVTTKIAAGNVGVAVSRGGTAVAVGRMTIGVLVGTIGVLVGTIGVLVGGRGVLVGGRGVLVGTMTIGVLVGGKGVFVGGTGVSTEDCQYARVSEGGKVDIHSVNAIVATDNPMSTSRLDFLGWG